MKSLAKNSVFNLIYSVANLLFPIITSMYVSRILLPEGMGLVSHAQNIVSYFVVFASLGIPIYGVREAAKVRDDREKTNKLFAELVVINGVTTAVSACVFAFLVLYVDAFVEERVLFLCCGLHLVLNSINIDWFYKGIEEYAYIVLRSLLIKVISIIAIFLFVKTREDYAVYALISSVAVAGNYIFNIIHARKYVKLTFKNLEFRKHLQPIMVLAVSVLLGSIYTKLDMTMLGSLPTKAPAGFYSSANRLVDLVLNLCSSVLAVFLPRLSHYYANDIRRFREYVRFGFNVLCFLVPPVFVGLNLVARYAILLVYGEAFAPAIETIRILSVLIIIKSFGDLLCYQVAIVTGNEKKRLPAYVIAALLNVVLNAILIPPFAQNGAAVASVASELALNGYLFISLSRISNVKLEKKGLLQAIFSTAVMAVCVASLSYLEMGLFLKCVLMVSVGAIVYFIVNYIMRNEIMIIVIEKVMTRKV